MDEPLLKRYWLHVGTRHWSPLYKHEFDEDLVRFEEGMATVPDPTTLTDIAERIDPAHNGELQRFAAMGEAMAYFLLHCWQRPNGQRRDMRGACCRFAALSMTVRPDLFDGETFKSVAKELRVTRALLSKLSLEFSRKVGLKFRFNQHVSGAATRWRRLHPVKS